MCTFFENITESETILKNKNKRYSCVKGMFLLTLFVKGDQIILGIIETININIKKNSLYHFDDDVTVRYHLLNNHNYHI